MVEIVGYQRRDRRVGSHDWNAWLPCSADAFNQIGANRTIGGFELESRALVLATDYTELQTKLDAVTKDSERLDFLIEWFGWNDDLEGSGIRDWIDYADARAAIDAALTDQGRAGEGRNG